MTKMSHITQRSNQMDAQIQPNYTRNAKPIQVRYTDPNGKECKIHYNLSLPENFERFTRLVIWASIHNIELTIKSQVSAYAAA